MAKTENQENKKEELTIEREVSVSLYNKSNIAECPFDASNVETVVTNDGVTEPIIISVCKENNDMSIGDLVLENSDFAELDTIVTGFRGKICGIYNDDTLSKASVVNGIDTILDSIFDTKSIKSKSNTIFIAFEDFDDLIEHNYSETMLELSRLISKYNCYQKMQIIVEKPVKNYSDDLSNIGSSDKKKSKKKNKKDKKKKK